MDITTDQLREMARVAFKAGWISRDLRSTGPQRWSQLTGRDAELTNAEEMIAVDYDEFLAEVRDPMADTLSTTAQRARSMRRHPSRPRDGD